MIIQNNEIVWSPCLCENPNDISCVNTDWITFAMVLCVLGISANHPINVSHKQLINATSELIDPTLYIVLQRDDHTQIFFSDFHNAIYQSDI